MRKALIICYGYMGDHLFASSIAKKLKEENQFDVVDYVVGFPQVVPLMQLNPYIDKVIFNGQLGPSPAVHPNDYPNYDRIVQLGQLSFEVQPCIEMQRIAGVNEPTADFTVYTDPTIDHEIERQFADVRAAGLPVVAIMASWQPKAFGFTREEYAAGVNVPLFGYGGRLRDIPRITAVLREHFVTIDVGAPDNVSQFDTALGKFKPARSLLEEASVLKHCDYFVGAEGGLANLASGVGCKTILTSDFVHQLYGWNGVIKKIPDPPLGPRFYFPTGHIDLDPYLTDDEVIASYLTLIQPK